MGCATSTAANSNQVNPAGDRNIQANNNTNSKPVQNKPIANGHVVETNESNNNQAKAVPAGKPVAFEIGFEKPGAYNSLVNQPPQKFKVYNIQFSFRFSIIHCLSYSFITVYSTVLT